jgi:hypothetical protein
VRIVLILLLTGTLCEVAGQSWNFSVEGGINSSGMPGRYAGGTRSLPKLSPVLGARVIYQVPAGFYSAASVRYYSVATTLTTRTKYYSGMDDGWHNIEEEERYFFHKLAYGLGLGYQFHLWKTRIDISGGYRLVYYSAGSFSYHLIHTHPTGVRSGYRMNYDPMDNPNLETQASRDGHEVYFGLGIGLTEKVTLAVQCTLPSEIHFTEFNGYTRSFSRVYSANDLSLTAFYRLGR